MYWQEQQCYFRQSNEVCNEGVVKGCQTCEMENNVHRAAIALQLMQIGEIAVQMCSFLKQ
jgi:hypothetical protein